MPRVDKEWVQKVDVVGDVPIAVAVSNAVAISGEVEIKNGSGDPIPVKSTATPGLSIPEHDYQSGAWTNGRLTGVTYKRGGVNGVTVATLTLAYDANGNWISTTRA